MTSENDPDPKLKEDENPPGCFAIVARVLEQWREDTRMVQTLSATASRHGPH